MKYRIESPNDLKPSTPKRAIDYVVASSKGMYRLDAWRTSAVMAAFASKRQAVCEKDFDLLHVKGDVPEAVDRDWFRENLSNITLIKVKPVGRIADDEAGHYSVSLTDSECGLADALGNQCKFAVVDLEKSTHQILTLRQMWLRMRTMYAARNFVF